MEKSRTEFQITLTPDWPINNCFFSGPTLVHTQILIHMQGGTKKIDLGADKLMDLTWGLVLSVL